MLAHIPLFFLLFVWLSQPDNSRLIFGLDVFFVIHVGLHLLFLLHKKNEFKDWISWTIIVGAGMFGLADLLL
jgi:L-cystine uptake protein TcyP (sodium:dicarboxylate symporter family)